MKSAALVALAALGLAWTAAPSAPSWGPEPDALFAEGVAAYEQGDHARSEQAFRDLLEDGVVHPTINLENPDPECELANLVANEPREVGRIETLLNTSFGMLGINSAVIVRAWRA